MSPTGVILKILSQLLLLLISFSFSQEAINYETTLIEKDGIFYTKDTNKPYSGPVFSLFEDGEKKSDSEKINLNNSKTDQILSKNTGEARRYCGYYWVGRFFIPFFFFSRKRC